MRMTLFGGLIGAALAVPALAGDVTVETATGPAPVPSHPETIAVFDIAAVDTLVALLAAALMIIGAARIAKQAVDSLMDRKAPDAIEGIIAALARDHHGVRDFHDLKTRMAGSQIFVVLHIELDGDQSLREAHDIGADLRQKILAACPNADVTIHKDVWQGG